MVKVNEATTLNLSARKTSLSISAEGFSYRFLVAGDLSGPWNNFKENSSNRTVLTGRKHRQDNQCQLQNFSKTSDQQQKHHSFRLSLNTM